MNLVPSPSPPWTIWNLRDARRATQYRFPMRYGKPSLTVVRTRKTAHFGGRVASLVKTRYPRPAGITQFRKGGKRRVRTK